MKQALSALVATLAFGSGAAQADVIYSYTSGPLTPWVAGGTTFGTDTSPLTISLDFTDDGSTLLDWTASQRTVGTINKANSAELPDFGLNATFKLDTDSSGNVIAWYVDLWTQTPRQSDGSIGGKQNLFSFNEEIYGFPFPGAVEAWDLAVLANPVFGLPPSYLAGLPGPSGTWTSTGELDKLTFEAFNPGYVAPTAIPEPGNTTLMLAALGVLRLALRHRKS